MKIKELFNKKDFFGEFSKNVLVLMTGTTIAQAIPIAISPILTRIYTPEQFGIFALYLSISSFFAAASTGRYELAIMLPKNDEDAANVGVLAMIIALCISIFTLILIIIFNHQIASLLNNEDVSTWLYFIPVAVFLTRCLSKF